MSVILWGLYWPLLRFVSLLVFWVPGVRARVAFEKKNLKDQAIADYKTAQTLDPTNAFAKAGLARLGATP